VLACQKFDESFSALWQILTIADKAISASNLGKAAPDIPKPQSELFTLFLLFYIGLMVLVLHRLLKETQDTIDL